MRRLALLVALLTLTLAPGARAAYDPLGGGTAKIVLDKGFARFLKEDGVKLKAQGGAKRKGQSFALPISGGSLDPTKGKGEIEAEGTLVFAGGRKSVPLRDISLKTESAPLVAKVGGSQLKVATSASRPFKRVGFDSVFTAHKLRLTAKAITRLNKKLRPAVPFAEGQLLGSLVAQAEPRVVTIAEGGRATLVFDPSFVKKLDSRFVSLNPIFPAEHVGSTFTFPVVPGGALAPDASEGTLRTGGEVEMLQLHGGQVFWKEEWFDFGAKTDTAEVDIEPAPSFPGKLGRVGILAIGQGTVSADPKARTISVAGASLSLSEGAAASLNEAFAQSEVPVFAAGEAAGTLSFTAQGQ